MVKKIKLESSFRQATEAEVNVVREQAKSYANKQAMKCMTFVRWSLITLILAFFLNNVLLKDFDLPRFVTILFTAIALVSGVVFSISMVLAVRKNLALFSLNGGSIKVLDCEINAYCKGNKVQIATSDGTLCSDEFPSFNVLGVDEWDPKYILAQTRFGGFYGVFRLTPEDTVEEGEEASEEVEEVSEVTGDVEE